MKKRNILIGLLITGILLVFVTSCGATTEELARDVQETYLAEWRSSGIPISITKDLILVKKNRTEYTGLMTVSAYGESEVVTVNVVYDGKTWTSQIEGW